MKTVDVNISIPVNAGRYSPRLILELICETLEDKFTEIDDMGNDCGEETIADTHGFGGNTLLLTCGDEMREICL